MEHAAGVQRGSRPPLEADLRGGQVEERETGLDALAGCRGVGVADTGVHVRVRQGAACEILVRGKCRVVVETVVLGIEAQVGLIDADRGDAELEPTRDGMLARIPEALRPAPAQAEMEGVQTGITGAVVVKPCAHAEPVHPKEGGRVRAEAEGAVGGCHRSPLLAVHPVEAIVAIELPDGGRAQCQRGMEELREVDVLAAQDQRRAGQGQQHRPRPPGRAFVHPRHRITVTLPFLK